VTYPAKVELCCRRCGRTKTVCPSAARQRTSAKLEDGRWTYLCRTCQGRERLHTARAVLLADYGVTSRSSDAERSEAARRHLTETVFETVGRKISTEKNLRWETYTERGKVEVKQRRDAARERLTDKGRADLALGIAVSKVRRGEWRPCPLCHLLVYLSPSRVEQASRGFHASCYHEWQRGAEYREWLKQQRANSKKPMARRRRNPMPLPVAPSNRPPSNGTLERGFRWTIQHYGLGKSWRAIAEADNYEHPAIIKSAKAFIARLPDRWEMVFGASRNLLDDLLPITQLRRAAGLSPSSPTTSEERASEFLRKRLAEGPVDGRTVKAEATEHGYTFVVLRRARIGLAIRRKRVGFGPGSHVLWMLAEKG
jgi:hypothetical protein